jgi:hypothetical protein
MATSVPGQSEAPRTTTAPRDNLLLWRIGLATVGLTGVVVYLAILIVSPFLRPDVDLLWGALSDYAVGPFAEVKNAGFITLGIGSLAIALSLALAPLRSRWVLPGVCSLTIAGVACVGLAAFPMGVPQPTTILGDAHQTAGTLSVAFHLAAMLAITLAARVEPPWQRFVPAGAALFAVALLGALLVQAELLWAGLPIPFGLASRIMVVPVLGWWTIVAIRLRSAPR